MKMNAKRSSALLSSLSAVPKSASPQILTAVARKVQIDPGVSLRDIARETDGFSGADLQALVYNAHLEGIHANLSSSEDRRGGGQEEALVFMDMGASSTGKVASKAERAALERRVCSSSGCRGTLLKLFLQLRQVQAMSSKRSTSKVAKASERAPHPVSLLAQTFSKRM